MNIEELKDWHDDARRGLQREVEELIEKKERIDERKSGTVLLIHF